jgi:hypothetical protein
MKSAGCDRGRARSSEQRHRDVADAVLHLLDDQAHRPIFQREPREAAGAVAGVPLQGMTAAGEQGEWVGNGVQSISLER